MISKSELTAKWNKLTFWLKKNWPFAVGAGVATAGALGGAYYYANKKGVSLVPNFLRKLIKRG